jgi:LysM repeat protein
MKKYLIVTAMAAGLLIQSCLLSPPGAQLLKETDVERPDIPAVDPQSSELQLWDDILEADEIIIPLDSEAGKIVEIYRGDILNNCERKFLDLLQFYRTGELTSAKLIFDSLLETLEYLYGDQKVPDTVMLEQFWKEFSDRNLAESVNIGDIYRDLYYEKKSIEPDELVIEQSGSGPKTEEVSRNNAEFIYVSERLKEIMTSFNAANESGFTDKVYENYISNLNDRIRIKEIYIRSLEYSDFIKKKLRDNGLNAIYFYLPSVNTAYYEGRNNGSVWGLERSKNYCERARNNSGASTAIVTEIIKDLKKKYGDLKTLAALAETGRYNLDSSDIADEVLTDNFANFLSLAILLENPSDHELESSDHSPKDNSFDTDFAAYRKDKNKFCSVKTVSQKKQTAKPLPESKGSGSFIRINYKVKKGDNLQKIADVFGVTVNQIKEWNPKDAGKKVLSPGVNLFIRGDKFQYYTARSGDSVGKIASKFKMSESDFKKINELKSNTIIKGRKYIVKKN